MNNSIIVERYDFERLVEYFAEYSKATRYDIGKKCHLNYLNGYLKELSVCTFIVEPNYVDRDFLEDYSKYYVKCFEPYDRFCTRFHFFDRSFKNSNFVELLKNYDEESFADFNSSYLGFIVLKHLPNTIIGRTCLKPYPSEKRRLYPVVHNYEANLHGITFSIKSLPFQEQDATVAACATSALWSAFHGTGLLFHHEIPKPIEITESATLFSYHRTERALPNLGLTMREMAHSIKNIGLEPEFIDEPDHLMLKASIYAYLKSKVPIVWLIWLKEIPQADPDSLHAVTITGLSIDNQMKSTPENESPINLRAFKIDKIYVHDDQIGPFARMEFDGLPTTVKDEQGNDVAVDSLSTSWRNVNDPQLGGRAISLNLLVPLYHKIRIPFKSVLTVVTDFNEFIKKCQENEILEKITLEWDIYLTAANDFKTDLLHSRTLDNCKKVDILSMSMPRFIWRATAFHNDEMIIDLLFDATDIEQGGFFFYAILYSEEYSGFIFDASSLDEMEEIFIGLPAWQIIEWFRKNQKTES